MSEPTANGNRATMWRVLALVVPFVSMAAIGIVQIYTHQQVQEARMTRLETFVYTYIADHEERHKDDLVHQRGRDQGQEDHFRSTDAAVSAIRDTQNQRSEWVTRVRELEQGLRTMQLQMQRVEDQIKDRMTPRLNPHQESFP